MAVENIGDERKHNTKEWVSQCKMFLEKVHKQGYAPSQYAFLNGQFDDS